jgi:tetraacyldisaccharide 4'-kinase
MRSPDFWARGGDRGAGALLALGLTPLSWAWQLGAWIKRRQTTGYRAGVPVVSIGNLTAGGAGKTPTAIALAERLIARGRRPHVVTRGYGGSAKGPHRVDAARDDAALVGDEALLLARVAPTWVARRRALGALAATRAGADVILLDDAHQHWSLLKDLSLVVIDQGYGVGNGRVIPAGPLREPVAAGMARADAIVAIGEGPAIATGSAVTGGGKPVLRARLVPAVDPEHWRHRRVLAFAGIGRPEKFFRTLADLGCDIVATRAFADHQPYDPDTVMRLIDEAAANSALLVTTEKDYVRLPPAGRDVAVALPVRLEFSDTDAVDRLLARLPRVRT